MSQRITNFISGFSDQIVDIYFHHLLCNELPPFISYSFRNWLKLRSELTLLRRENGVPVENLLAIVLKQTVIFAKWRHSVKVTTLLDQGNIALITSDITLHHTVFLILFTDVFVFVLVVI